MKKIIIASFVFALLLVSQNVGASSLWNGASNDCPGIAISNQTTNVGIVIPCWPLKNVSANNGESVNIRFYYHNTSTSNATNVKFTLNAPTGEASSHTFSGQITSDQGSLSLGSVTATTAPGTRLVFSSAHFLPNQSQTESAIPLGQTTKGTEILGGGLNIGTVAPGWNTQGSIVVAFAVVGPTNPPANVPTGTLTPNKTSCSISLGQNSCDINFSWNTTNPVGTSAVVKDGGSTVATGNSGSKAFTVPYNSATFRLYNNALELDNKTVTSYCTTGTSWNGSVCAQAVTPTDSCTITSFTVGGALSSTVTLGNGVDLAWTTTGCTSVNIPGVGINLNTNDSKTVFPTTPTTYIATAVGPLGSSAPRTVSVTVTQDINPTYACSITNFTVDGLLNTTVISGRSVEIAWDTANCTSINIQGVGSNLPSSGSYVAYPNRNTRYTIIASGLVGGTQTRSVDVTVTQDVNPTYSCSITDFSADQVYITAGSSVNLNWSTSNCSNVVISNIGNVYTSGSRILNPGVTTNYILTAYGSNSGMQTRSVLVTVNRPYYNNNIYNNYVAPIVQPFIQPFIQQPVTPVYNNCAVTTVATNLGQNTAQLNGLVTGTVGASTYFDYGTTVNLGSRTNTRFVNSNTNFTETITGLTPNTIYYFRLVSNCQNGQSLGSIEVFRTTGVQTVANTTKTIVVQGTTVVGTNSPILLNISNRYQAIGAGDLIDYVVNYKNIGKTKLTHPLIQVVLPTDVTLVNASRGTYSVDTHTLSAQIEDLEAGQEGVIFLQGKVDSIPLNNSQIATTAILIYTGPSGAQENAMAYVINVPRLVGVVSGTTTDASVLGGAAFFGGLLSFGLIGWLVIILLILLVILVARSYGGRTTQETITHTTTH